MVKSDPENRRDFLLNSTLSCRIHRLLLALGEKMQSASFSKLLAFSAASHQLYRRLK